MPTMELTASNEEILKGAGDLINLTGLTTGCYYDKFSGCYCALGAIRMMIFGITEIYEMPLSEDRVVRYHEVVRYLATKVGWQESSRYDPHGHVGGWNDNSDKDTVVRVLRGEV